MADDSAARRLWRAGLALFLFGLAFGFFVKAIPNPRLALSAHLNAVQSGTFLIALGLLWPRLAVWPRAAMALSLTVCVSFWTLEAGMVLAAFAPPTGAGDSALNAAAQMAILAGAVVMLVALGALLAPFGRRANGNVNVAA